ncbi:hypothetical protein PRIPAC_79904 [Pristionchus pacificus]|uniref:Uncharacterized protein n=1 Tax=Pristionchus pacificus TaxID=54126 RepID=A0A454XY35_PRIPA|nr:hypothetical protein PRIPAC_79904 [Pristionchus pacificus]|eukprot:PDM73126.1 hypothetical protein PRIPAC_39560 [Pristionchus pacificus]
MLSTTVRRLASATARSTTQATASRDPTIKYEFVPAESRDKGEIMDLTLNHFFTIEPHSRALGLAGEDNKEFVDWIVSKALKYPHSYRIVHRESKKLIGIRLMSEWETATKDDLDDIDISKLDENTLIILGILENLKKRFCELRPGAKKVLRREMTFVHHDHQRQGIAQHLVHLGLDVDEFRARGFDGIMSEASSIANQTLLAKNGYVELARARPKDYIRSNGEPIVFPDETRALKLFYLCLKK